jgi:hypothetical protein
MFTPDTIAYFRPLDTYSEMPGYRSQRTLRHEGPKTY